MKLSTQEIETVLKGWNKAWDNYDLDLVASFFHTDIYFENWTGGYVCGKENLKKSWEPWFETHGNFKFVESETFIDEHQQKALYSWILKWPSFEKGFEGKPEIRKGVDIIHFKDGKIFKKLSFSKTTLEIEGIRMGLHP
jgi:hypothetical protein